MIRSPVRLVIVVALLLQGAPAAQVPAPQQAPPAQPAPSCSSPEHRQFDFWIGRWNVTANGKMAGTNEITPILDGCVLKESWKGAGMSGTSLNAWDPSDRQWHQTWMDDKGLVLKISGGLREGRMVMSGEAGQYGNTTRILQRITWEKLDADHLRQVWEISPDKGATWNVIFDGRYERAAP